ncbi:PqqD family peptide modification chaperone [Niveibacterium terrae]|uniref:PqqD family peptide modification chaperone n=1 Tax=Niveibacterium terrae TaxID=3373598 RepID=UPI003A8F808F
MIEKVQLQDRVVQVSGCVTADVAGDMVVSNVETGCYVGLNPTAQAIWNLMSEPVAVGGLCEILCARYAVDAAVCEAQVLQTLDRLLDQGLIRRD